MPFQKGNQLGRGARAKEPEQELAMPPSESLSASLDEHRSNREFIQAAADEGRAIEVVPPRDGRDRRMVWLLPESIAIAVPALRSHMEEVPTNDAAVLDMIARLEGAVVE